MPPGQTKPIDLPRGHDTMDTNTMGDCVALVLLWGIGPNNSPPYAHVRGWHGMGGLGAIDMDQMFLGVPAPSHVGACDPQAIVLGSSMGSVSYLCKEVSDMVEKACPGISTRVCKSAARYTVRNDGIVNVVIPQLESIKGTDALKYLVREKHFKGDSTRISPMLSLTDSPPTPTLLQGGGEVANFHVGAGGPGQLTGVTYSVPAHSIGKITYTLKVPCLTSKTVENLSKGWKALLNASQKESFEKHVESDTTASANLSFLGFFSGGGKVSTTVKTSSDHMKKIGLTDDQITKAMDMLADAAKEMSSVKAKILVFNTGNDYPVSGNQLIYTMSGEVTTGNGTNSWRMMSSGGQAGDGQAPTTNNVVPALA